LGLLSRGELEIVWAAVCSGGPSSRDRMGLAMQEKALARLEAPDTSSQIDAPGP